MFKPSIKHGPTEAKNTIQDLQHGQLFTFEAVGDDNIYQVVDDLYYRPVGWEYDTTPQDRRIRGIEEWPVRRVRITCMEISYL